MKEQLPKEMAPYDLLCEAIEDFIASTYQRATPESVPPMIASLAEIRTAVESGIDNLLDTGQLTSKGFSTIWMMGAAHEWLDALRDWEDEHFKPQLELEIERLATSEAEASELLESKAVKRTGVKKATKPQAAKKAATKKRAGKKIR
ncbi:MAG: hypothetical protein JNK38_02995 [Acidobacteria bacterium]|nr:hypothetical protein [Acidobacteriota bacterium]